MAGPKNELMLLFHKLRDVTAMLGESEHARDHLRQQSNELKALALCLVRMLKTWRANAAEEEASIAGEGPEAGRAAWEVGMAEPLAITRDEWKAATDSDETKAGKGIVLLVERNEETGEVLVDLGDIEHVAPAKVGEA